MSARLNPCYGCPIVRGKPRDACDMRNQFRAKIAGLGLRSATFNCAILAAKLAPGARVKVRHPILVESGSEYQEYDIVHHDLPATITFSLSNEFSCVIDRDALIDAMDGDKDQIGKVDTYRFRKKMKHSRIVTFLDEAPRKICSGGNVVNPDTLDCDQRNTDVECACQTHERYAA